MKTIKTNSIPLGLTLDQIENLKLVMIANQVESTNKNLHYLKNSAAYYKSIETLAKTVTAFVRNYLVNIDDHGFFVAAQHSADLSHILRSSIFPITDFVKELEDSISVYDLGVIVAGLRILILFCGLIAIDPEIIGYAVPIEERLYQISTTEVDVWAGDLVEMYGHVKCDRLTDAKKMLLKLKRKKKLPKGAFNLKFLDGTKKGFPLNDWEALKQRLKETKLSLT